ncbi:MAG: TonB family protein [Sulfuritalea sp.]|nr:TonB family protein [Sulfuritalea sp.]
MRRSTVCAAIAWRLRPRPDASSALPRAGDGVRLGGKRRRIRVEVGSDGRPHAATLARSSGYEVLDRAALTMIDAGALRARRLEPARRGVCRGLLGGVQSG